MRPRPLPGGRDPNPWNDGPDGQYVHGEDQGGCRPSSASEASTAGSNSLLLGFSYDSCLTAKDPARTTTKELEEVRSELAAERVEREQEVHCITC